MTCSCCCIRTSINLCSWSSHFISANHFELPLCTECSMQIKLLCLYFKLCLFCDTQNESEARESPKLKRHHYGVFQPGDESSEKPSLDGWGFFKGRWLGEERVNDPFWDGSKWKWESNCGIKMKRWKAKGSSPVQAGTRRAQLQGLLSRHYVQVLIFLVRSNHKTMEDSRGRSRPSATD